MTVQRCQFQKLLEVGIEQIVMAAVRLPDGRIFTGRSHLDVALDIITAEPDFDPENTPVEDGFVTSWGRFISREDAHGIAVGAGQVGADTRKDLQSELVFASQPRRVLIDLLQEKLSFDQLFALSEPKRVLRSKTVRGPELDVESYRNSMYYFFRFKAYPSTTGRRHRGYIKFFKPDDPDTPLEQVECEVDCACPDYRYRWAWANSQRDSSQIGSSSINKCVDRAPRITNPTGRPGLCKHLLALRDFLYGQDSQFPPSDDPDSSDRLQRLVSAADGVTIDDQGQRVPSPEEPDGPTVQQVPASQDRERRLAQRVQGRRRGENPDETPTAPEASETPRESRQVVNNVNAQTEIKLIEEVAAAAKEDATSVDSSQPSGQQALDHLRNIEDLLRNLVELSSGPEVKDDAPDVEEPEDLPEPPQDYQEEPVKKIVQP